MPNTFIVTTPDPPTRDFGSIPIGGVFVSKYYGDIRDGAPLGIVPTRQPFMRVDAPVKREWHAAVNLISGELTTMWLLTDDVGAVPSEITLVIGAA